ncbi:MAG: B12-binding domain-containing radical SAM protein, partial [Candidatus Omnitrophota bacterium]|nr:B12-binding domain-containing radical SAM protein [Candidatus Omnitrophota bacterium]
CRLSNRLKTLDWDDYDMKQPVMQSAVADERIMDLIQEMYKVSYTPEFIIRKFFSLRDIDDLKYFTRAAKKVIGHVFDFRHLKI